MKKLFAAALFTCLLAACNTEKESSDNDHFTYTGTMTVTDAQNAVTYQASDVRFDLIEQNDVLSVVMNEVKFAPMMPPFTIVITHLEGIPVSGSGLVLTSTVTPIVPLIGGTPYESFKIPEFSGSVVGRELNIEFRCVSEQFRLDHKAVYKGTRTN